MELSDLRLEDACYVVLQLRFGPAHAITKFRHDLIWYPETSMGLIDQITYRPYVKSIVTENPWLVSCYDREDVYIWEKDGRRKAQWVHPNIQTYGGDHTNIYSMMGISSMVPAMALDGARRMKKFVEKETKKRR